MDNTISHTICIDTEKLTDIRNIENKLKKEISKTYRELMVEILSKKEEEILKNKNYIKKGKVSRVSLANSDRLYTPATKLKIPVADTSIHWTGNLK